MKQSQRWSSIFFNLFLLAGLVFVWIAFAPIKVGGRASYVMVNGISMEPNYHTGDLVIVRKQPVYQVGNVVAYRDAQMSAYVIHRIIGIEQRQYVLKGDNNSWIDAYHPDQNEVAGKQWIYLPKAGRAILWLRVPANLSLVVVLVGGVFMTNQSAKPSIAGKGKNLPSFHKDGMLEGTLYLLGFLFMVFMGLSIFAFTRPLTRAADDIEYQQGGSYSYSASGTVGVYDTDIVHSGEPVFPKLTCSLNIAFTYAVIGSQLEVVAGSQQMYMRVLDEQSGWQRTIPLVPPTAFTGNSYSATSTLDLCQLDALINQMETTTGLHANSYGVEIVSSIEFATTVSGQAITDTFTPTLVFRYDKIHLFLANMNAEDDPMNISQKGLVASTNVEPNTILFLGLKPTVTFLRILSLLGLGLTLSGSVLVGLSVYNTTRQSAEALIRLRYGAMLVEVHEKNLEPLSTMIDVISIDGLAKIAERQGSMILYTTVNSLFCYYVQSNNITYRYMVGDIKRNMIPVDGPAHKDIQDRLPSSNVNRMIKIEPASDITSDTELAEKVMLRCSMNADKNHS